MRRLVFLVVAALAGHASGADFTLNGHVFTVPEGFVVELVAGPPLVDRPIVADFDEQGRLYVADSSGSNEKVEQQLAERPHRIIRLEDSNGDGVFDRRTIFADKMMFPEGAMWLAGSLYVSAPPSIWKLTDADGDGVAEQRIEWFKGKTLTNCANDLHGPYRGPDGWIYWCKGGFAEQTYERPGQPPLVTKAAHVFRAKPDGSGVEPVLTGGMDNPVGLAFTPTGELLVSGTFFQNPAAGQRDGVLHAIYGGVYGKENSVLAGHPRTGDLMPIMTHLGPAAPAGMVRCETGGLGTEYRGNVFVACFNLHKVTRHVLAADGSTFKTRDEDFLVAQDSDFHPTDVREGADGSLLILDTGGWYKLCCPTSQLSKPDVLGAIYRVRRKELAPASAPAGEAPLRALWVQVRLATPAAKASVRAALEADDEALRLAALHAISLWRDGDALEKTIPLLTAKNPQAQRRAAEALGRIGDRRAVPALLAAAAQPGDRARQHAITFALLEIGDAGATSRGLESENAGVLLASLYALEQMKDGGLRAKQVTPRLLAADAAVREAATWIAGRHPEWGDSLVEFFRERLARESWTEAERGDLQRLLTRFAEHPAVQPVLASKLPRPAQLLALRVMAESRLKQAPASWIDALTKALESGDAELQDAVIAAARALTLNVDQATALRSRLRALMKSAAATPDLRVAAGAAMPGGIGELDAAIFDFLKAHLSAETPFLRRANATAALISARLTPKQLAALAETAKTLGAIELGKVLPLFKDAKDEALGMKLLESLRAAPGAAQLTPATLKPALAAFPAAVQRRADELLVSLNTGLAEQRAHLEKLAASLKDGDIRRGQAVFNSPNVGCSACHAIGYLGGDFAPDLTKVGTVRSERDLLEAIVFPSASFVRSYEPVMITLKSGATFSGLLREDSPEGILLALGPGAQMRFPRADIAELAPGTMSPMPPGFDKILTPQQLADLLAFLRATKW